MMLTCVSCSYGKSWCFVVLVCLRLLVVFGYLGCPTIELDLLC
jgi:hypothetical protein